MSDSFRVLQSLAFLCWMGTLLLRVQNPVWSWRSDAWGNPPPDLWEGSK
jgi:hypothetical protein